MTSGATGRINLLANRARPGLQVGCLLVTDLVTLAIANGLALVLRGLLPGGERLAVADHVALWPGLLVFPAVFAALGLYRTALVNPADELRRITGAGVLVYLLATAAPFITRVPQETYSRGFLAIAAALTIITVPLARNGLRHACGRMPWWGHPVVVLGAGLTGAWVVRLLKRTPALGLKPVVVLDDDVGKHGELHGVTVTGGLDRAPRFAESLQIRHVILAMPGAPVDVLHRLEQQNQGCFPHLLVIPNLCGFASLWVEPRDLGGLLSLEVRRNLLLWGPRITKRIFDLLLCVLFAVPLLLLLLVLVVAITLDSRGPVFYRQERLGLDGRRFKVWKFRSMARDADQVLNQYLADHPDLREEWERDHKLREDPRITRVGRFLRTTSLDELPQLINVVLGEMSLVGPRPIVDAEVVKYGEVYDLYRRVRPGLTGLWQVSGRNDTTYPERVLLDSTYVRNWSVWLDLVILAKTVWVVLRLRGAY